MPITNGPRNALTHLIEQARDAMQQLRDHGVDASPERDLITALVKAQERYQTATRKYSPGAHT